MTTIIYRIVAPVGDEDGGMKREGVLSTGVLYMSFSYGGLMT